MKVNQLIEALLEMPGEAELEFHANNHTTSLGDTAYVVKIDTPKGFVCMIGNMDADRIHRLNKQNNSVSEPVFVVRNYGSDQGRLLKGKIVYEPSRLIRRVSEVWSEARTGFVKEET